MTVVKHIKCSAKGKKKCECCGKEGYYTETDVFVVARKLKNAEKIKCQYCNIEGTYYGDGIDGTMLS